MDDEYMPPCFNRNEWTIDADSRRGRPPEDVVADRADVIRAKMVCYLQCSRRTECLNAALETPHEDDWFVWGGTTRDERQEIRQNGYILGPTGVPLEIRDKTQEQLDLMLTWAHPNDLAEHWDTSPDAVVQRMRKYLWTLRLNDPLVKLRNHATSTESTVSEEVAQSVAAA